MTPILTLMLTIALVLGTGGCDSDDGIICTTECVPGITVNVLDASTMEPAMCDAVGYLVEGSYIETMTNYADCPQQTGSPYERIVGALERPGVYTVIIVKEGYQLWARSGIWVDEDECHVITVDLEAQLEPEG